MSQLIEKEIVDKKPVVVVEIPSEKKDVRRREWWERSMEIHMRKLKMEKPRRLQNTDAYPKKFQENIQKLREKISDFKLMKEQEGVGNYAKDFQEDIKKIRNRIYNIK